ncbi:MAG: hypothetical protein EPN70_05950 [Paraburkholderia sp.]|uniref:hypothetical protein n=1 Tax=Paraburkholderia sp. TaxID=1926495 RepID=UPI0011F5989A|nr:hypothetical protein [Paraburkholderia sp.]TAM06386.1 MAG: hypothetical protein EPN70_05950 [Paraburkholderia sp.]
MKRSSRSSVPRQSNRPHYRIDESDSPCKSPQEEQPKDAPVAPTLSDAGNAVYARLAKLLGARGAKRLKVAWLTTLVIALTVGSVWPYRDAISDVPVVADTIENVVGSPLPTALPGEITILVAEFDGDKDHATEQLLLTWMGERRLAALALGRHIHVPTSLTSLQSRQDAEKVAQQYLAKTGAQLLVWGKVHRAESGPVLEIHYTVPPNTTLFVTWRLYCTNGQQVVSVVFAEDLVSAIRTELKVEEDARRAYAQTVLPQIVNDTSTSER